MTSCVGILGRKREERRQRDEKQKESSVKKARRRLRSAFPRYNKADLWVFWRFREAFHSEIDTILGHFELLLNAFPRCDTAVGGVVAISRSVSRGD